MKEVSLPVAVDKKNIASGFLTKQEETYWAENLQVDAREVPQMPECSMVTMKTTTPVCHTTNSFVVYSVQRS